MVTTFQDPELVRDDLTSIFTTDGSWQEVYGYPPNPTDFIDQTPILIVVFNGASQDFNEMETNPTEYSFLVSSWVLAASDSDNWTKANAESKVMELNQKIRQLIRNNAGGSTNADSYRFSGFSQVERRIATGTLYFIETHEVIATLARGAK